ncbi:hypothetical protein [Thermocrispum municipale]|jgi:hypothetical protein|uniref:hypothetical protein n=1 Tax=Thermocrispum municipale TaxID=37926 RepID=UPI0003FC5E8B|nr:hypothetical protein [Thermocrispum municipale]
MGTIVNLIAVVIAIASVLAALGHDAYLALLNNAAAKRAGGAPVAAYVRGRWAVALGATAVALVGWAMTGADSIAVDVLAALVAGGGGAVAVKSLRETQERYRIGG